LHFREVRRGIYGREGEEEGVRIQEGRERKGEERERKEGEKAA